MRFVLFGNSYHWHRRFGASFTFEETLGNKTPGAPHPEQNGQADLALNFEPPIRPAKCLAPQLTVFGLATNITKHAVHLLNFGRRSAFTQTAILNGLYSE
jgi:hypothetical protein